MEVHLFQRGMNLLRSVPFVAQPVADNKEICLQLNANSVDAPCSHESETSSDEVVARTAIKLNRVGSAIG